MFDFSFFELVVIGVVALIVIGPERMPKVARAAGLLFGRAQRYVSEVKADINNQLKLDELRKIEADLRAKASTAEHTIVEETHRVGQEFKSVLDTPSFMEAEIPFEPPKPSVEAPVPATPSPQLELGLDSARPQRAETSSQ